jgi:probable phosphoglycerate mutase
MTTFLLIRHGHTARIGHSLAGRLPGVELSDQGRAEAERLAVRLRDARVSAIYSSPLERAMQTAEPLARSLGLRVVPRPRLTEIDFGEWTGRTIESLEHDPLWQRFNILRSATRPPGGELILEVQTRLIDELKELCTAHIDEVVCVFSHQDTIKAAIAWFAGIPIDLFSRFTVSPASVSVLKFAPWGPLIDCINSSGDL